MYVIRRVFVNPGTPAGELQDIWDKAYRDTREKPGHAVVIAFAPGTYNAPYGGALVYEHEPVLHVRRPGAEVTISYVMDIGKWHVDYRSVMWQEGGAALWSAGEPGEGPAIHTTFLLGSAREAGIGRTRFPSPLLDP
jgi:hypothetical protein